MGACDVIRRGQRLLAGSSGSVTSSVVDSVFCQRPLAASSGIQAGRGGGSPVSSHYVMQGAVSVSVMLNKQIHFMV